MTNLTHKKDVIRSVGEQKLA